MDILPSGLRLQLGRGHRDAVHEQREVHGRRGVGLGVVDLAGHAEAIGVIQLAQLRGEVVRRREVGQVDVHPEVLDALAQHVDDPTGGQLVSEASLELALCKVRAPMQGNELSPFLLLAGAKKRQQLDGVQTKCPAVCRRVALVPTAGEKVGFDVLLERGLQVCLHVAFAPARWIDPTPRTLPNLAGQIPQNRPGGAGVVGALPCGAAHGARFCAGRRPTSVTRWAHEHHLAARPGDLLLFGR